MLPCRARTTVASQGPKPTRHFNPGCKLLNPGLCMACDQQIVAGANNAINFRVRNSVHAASAGFPRVVCLSAAWVRACTKPLEGLPLRSANSRYCLGKWHGECGGCGGGVSTHL